MTDATPDPDQLKAALTKLEELRGILPDDQIDTSRANLLGQLRAASDQTAGRDQPSPTKSSAPGEETRQSGSGIVSAIGRELAVNGITIGLHGQDPHIAQRHLYRYLEWLVQEYAPLRLHAIDQSAARTGRQPLALSNVYVNLNVDLRIPGESTLADYLQRERYRLPSRDSDVLRLVSALEAIAHHRHMVLLGAPGSGKSTLGRYLALILAQAGLGNQTALPRLGEIWPHGPLWPVQVILRQFAESLPADLDHGRARHLWDFIFAELSNCGLAPETGLLIQEIALKSGAMFLLDGLDEVGDPVRRARVLEAIAEFLHTSGDHSRLLLTARPYAWEAPEQRLAEIPAVYRLATLGDIQIDTFIDHWYTALADAGWLNTLDAVQKSGDLQRVIQRDDLRILAGNPLLLTLTATLHSNRARLPQDRADLYHEVVELMLQRWNEASGMDRSLLDALDIPTLKLSDLREAFQALAFDAHRQHLGQQGTADIPEGQLLAAFRPLLEGDYNKAALVVKYIEQRAALLLALGERQGMPRFTFPHRTFQEFLAACHLASRPDYSEQAEQLARSAPGHWREILLLAGRHAGAGRGIPAADALVYGQSIEHYRKEGRTITLDDLAVAILAAEQLLEIGRAVLASRPQYGAVRRRVTGWLAAALQEDQLTLAERVQAGSALSRLGDPRPGVGLRSDGLPDIVWCPVPGGEVVLEQEAGTFTVQPFYIARYPVTWTQYRAFLEAEDGFHNPQWWHDLSADEGHKSQPEPPHRPLDNHPAEGLSWYDATAFCRWLNDRLQQIGPPLKSLADTHWEIRLPAEWEWEQAATGGDPAHIYPWGPTWDNTMANTNESHLNHTTAVGMYPQAAAFAADGTQNGPLDMAGNVWEWCRNEYHHPANVQPEGEAVRALRGGSWFRTQRSARLDVRHGDLPNPRYSLCGFRLAIAPVTED